MMTKKSNLSLSRRVAVALSVVAMALLCVPATMQAQDNDDDRVSQAHHADVSSLPGKELDYKSYKEYISTGRPWDEKKMFLLYNVGAKKFLNLGSYWGTHAALSEVPRPFWLQRRNEVKTPGQWSYKRFVESADENKGYFSNDFFNLEKVQVGNVEGSKRAHATYIYVRKVRLDGTDSTDIVTPGTICDGTSFPTATDVAIDFNKEKIVARIDMSKCQATSSGGGKMETLFSVGQDVQYWDKDGVKCNNLHIYGFKSGDQCQLRVQPLDAHYSDAAYKSGGSENPITVTDGIVNIEITQQSILVNGVQCMPRNQAAYESALTSLLAQTSFYIGSAQGEKKTTSLYNYVKLTKASIYDDDPTHVLRPDVAVNGRAFSNQTKYDGTLADKEVEAVIDLSTCQAGDNENILSIGDGIKELYADGTDTYHNLHFYYDGTTLSLAAYDGTADATKWSTAATGTVKIKLNRTGLYFDDGTSPVTGFGPDNAVISHLIGSASEIQVGSEVGSVRSHATYHSLTVKTESTDVVTPGTKWDGKTTFSKQYVGSLADKEIMAKLDLSSCSGTSENILSIGTDIASWGDKGGGENIHIYYTKSSGVLQFDAVDTNYPGSQNRITKTLTGDAAKNVKITLTKDGLFLNDELLTGSGNTYDAENNAIIKYLVNDATFIQVGSAEGSSRSRATYTSLTVTTTGNTSAAAASVRGTMLAATQASAESEAEGSTNTIYENKQGDGNAFGADTAYGVSFADGDRIDASINLDNATLMENVISIGNSITEWGNRNNMHNLHVYFLKDDKYTDTGNNSVDAKLLQVVYVNKDHSDDNKRAVYIGKDSEGHYTLKLSLSKDGLTVNGLNITNVYPAMDPMPALPYSKYADRAGDIVRIKQDEWGNRLLDDTGHYIIAAADDEKDAHGVYVTNNGYIYTSESRSDETLPLFITSYFEQESTASGNEANYLSWAPYLKNNDKWGTVGVFADRALPSADLDIDQNKECAQWFFEPMAATDASEANHNTYRVYLKMKNVKRHTKPSGGQTGYETVDGTNKFYLQATDDYVYGNNLEGYDGDPTIADITLAEASEKPVTTADYDVWKLIDIAEYYTLFDSPESEMTSMLDLTYTMRDPDFTRENYELSRWHMDADSLLSADNTKFNVRIGYDHFSKKKLTDTDYTDESGKKQVKDSQGNWVERPSDEFIAVRQRTGNHARYMGVDVRNEGYGRFFQDVTVHNPGWYAVSCGGMTTVGAQLFVQMKKSDGSYSVPIYQPLHALTDGELKFLNATDHKWPFDQVDGSHPMPMYNALVAMNDRNIIGKTIDDDGKLKDVEGSTAVLADCYTSQVAFFVDPAVLKDSLTLRLGVVIPKESGDGTQALADGTEAATTADGAVSGRWTVFDNFHFMFGGKAAEPNIILDEDSTNLDYIERSLHVFEERPMRLHRTFVGNQWNTLILPVNLTKSDIVNAFGETAVLAELKSLTANTVEFESVKVDEIEDVMLKAFKPYIIKVDANHAKGKGQDDKGQPYSALFTRRDDSRKSDKVSITGGHFFFESVNLAGKHIDAATQQYYYSFADDTDGKQQTLNFDASTAYTAGKLYTYRDDYLATRTDIGAEGKLGLDNLRAYGTLCKNYKKAGTVLYGHHDLKDGYVMQNNNLYKIKNQYGTKGFRCWFASDDATGHLASNTKLSIDGIVDGTTGIADIYGDTGAPVVARFADGVYTIDGRKVRGGTSLDGLPAGVYIVSGRKTVVAR